MANITGKFDWQFQKEIPAFLQGEDAEAVYFQTEGIRTGTTGYDPQTKLVYGSTPFLSARVDTIVRPFGLRVVRPRDLSNPDIMKMIQGKHYSDTPALVLRSEEDSNAKNNPLIKILLEEASKAHEKLPFMVTGFDAVSWPEDNEGYKIRIVPRNDFEIVYDERLSGKYDSKTFSNTDERGLPNFDKNGNRTWFARQRGISGLYLDGDLDLGSRSGYLANSYDNGRVVVVNDSEGAAQNFLREHMTSLERALQEANTYSQGIVDDALAKLKR